MTVELNEMLQYFHCVPCLSVLNSMNQGFVSGALINVPLNDKLGFGRVSFRMFSVDDTTSDNVSGSLSRLSQLVRSIDRQFAHNPPPILL